MINVFHAYFLFHCLEFPLMMMMIKVYFQSPHKTPGGVISGRCQTQMCRSLCGSLESYLNTTVTSDDVLLDSLLCRRRWHLACLEDVWVSEQVMRCWDTDSSGWTDSMYLCLYRLMMEVCIHMYYWQGIYCTCTSMSILALYMDVLWLGRAYIHLHTPQSQLYCIVQKRYVHAVHNLLCVIKCYQKWLGYIDICFHIFLRGLCCHGHLRSLL